MHAGSRNGAHIFGIFKIDFMGAFHHNPDSEVPFFALRASQGKQGSTFQIEKHPTGKRFV